MKRIIFICLLCCLIFSFCGKKEKFIINNYKVVFVNQVYIDKGWEISDDNGNEIFEKEEDTIITNYIGVFPENNDTIIIYQFKKDIKAGFQKDVFWSEKLKNNKSINFHTSSDTIKVVFNAKNTVLVNNDTYLVNNDYYYYLKKEILDKKSVLDLAFFLKDGYGDYAKSLEPLNKNWRNQKENIKHKIISVKIKNQNYQADGQFFEYKANYLYSKDGKLKELSAENRYNKVSVAETKKDVKFFIQNGYNERSYSEEYFYKNKKTLFDSIIGNYTQNSNLKTKYYIKYQSKLKIKKSIKKPLNLEEALKILDNN